MSTIPFPAPDPAIMARRDEIVAGLANILPPNVWCSAKTSAAPSRRTR
jgi:hypothetical protein